MFGNSAHYPISISPNSPLLTSSNVWSHKAKCRNKLLFKFVLLVKSMFSRHNNGGMSLFFFSHRWWFLFFTAYLQITHPLSILQPSNFYSLLLRPELKSKSWLAGWLVGWLAGQNSFNHVAINIKSSFGYCYFSRGLNDGHSYSQL